MDEMECGNMNDMASMTWHDDVARIQLNLYDMCMLFFKDFLPKSKYQSYIIQLEVGNNMN